MNTRRKNTAWDSAYQIVLGLSLLLVAPTLVKAQTIDKQLAAYNRRSLVEKIYLHTDRIAYVSGETLWCKLYVVDGTYHRPLGMSTVAYVEVLDQANQPVVQGKMALKKGFGNGAFTLPATLQSGRYVVRAYTSWMKNFSAESYFSAPVDLISTAEARAFATKPVVTTPFDAQFFPEGGHLVQGIRSKVAFKLTDPQGRGVAAEGTVINQTGQPVATFKPLRFGMGTFELTPASTAATYTAVIKLPTGEVVRQPLPAAAAQGYTLQLVEDSPTELRLLVRATAATAAPVLLLRHARQLPPVLSTQPLADGRAEFRVSKQELAEGITHFTVFTADRQPVCERLYFKMPTRQLAVQATAAATYGTRQKVALALRTSNPQAQATAANLSVAVYRLDSLTATAATSISPYLWLTADLRGRIEQPAYYLSQAPDAALAADNLMLTQGWSRFAWADVLAPTPPKPTYAPELHGHIVQGQVLTRGTDAPRASIATYLASPGKAGRMYNAVSKEDGSVVFEMKDFYGSRELVVQPNNEVDSAYYVVLRNPFSLAYPAAPMPTLTTADLNEVALTQRYVQQQLITAYYPDKQERYLLHTPDTATFYGQPDHSFRLDDYTRFKTMEEVMREYVTGVQVRVNRGKFRYMVYDKINKALFDTNPMVLLDGVPVFNLNTVMAMDPLKVEKVDVITAHYFQGPLVYDGLVSYSTYKGDLQGLPLDARALLQTYDGLQEQREFYAPQYETPQQQQSRLPDFRSLLYWNPEVSTAAAGTQQFTFYTSDQPGTYQVVVQGLSAEGLAGSTSFTFEVKKPL